MKIMVAAQCDEEKPSVKEFNKIDDLNDISTEKSPGAVKETKQIETLLTKNGASNDSVKIVQNDATISETRIPTSTHGNTHTSVETAMEAQSFSDDDICCTGDTSDLELEIDTKSVSSNREPFRDSVASESDAESSSDTEHESTSDSDHDVASLPDVSEEFDEEGEAQNGPILSKNEIMDELAPSLPEDYKIPDNAPLEYVGDISALVEKNVIIKANVSGEFRILKENSVLCFEDRQVLGLLFETFGRLQSPNYRVKFNNEEDFKKVKQRKGEKVFYVVPESQFVYTDTIKKIRGTDASNCHDEELPEDEQEFSDDEREMAAKHEKKRKRKQKKSDKNTASLPTQKRHNGASEQNFVSYGFAKKDHTPQASQKVPTQMNQRDSGLPINFPSNPYGTPYQTFQYGQIYPDQSLATQNRFQEQNNLSSAQPFNSGILGVNSSGYNHPYNQVGTWGSGTSPYQASQLPGHYYNTNLHMQNTVAQHHQHWNPQMPSAAPPNQQQQGTQIPVEVLRQLQQLIASQNSSDPTAKPHSFDDYTRH